MELFLKRIIFSDKSTIGNLSVGNEIECFTLELPWKNNQKDVSCIPTGRYKVVMEYSQRFDRVLPELKKVPNRDEIKIHIANFPEELRGCIAVGQAAGADNLGRSRLAFEALFVKIAGAVDDGEEVWINIS